MQINQPAPDFELHDLNGHIHHLSDYRGRIVIVNFWSAECPHSERTDRAMMTMLARWPEAVALLSIAANCCESAKVAAQVSKARRLPIVLRDAGHAVADLFDAQTTPHA